MEKIRELLGRIGSLTAEELEGLRVDLLAEFDRVYDEPDTVENVALLKEITDAGAVLQGEQATRVQAQQEATEAKAAAKDAIQALRGEETEDETPEDGKDEPVADEPAEEPVAEEEAPDEPAEEPVDATEATEEVAVTASAVGAVKAGSRKRPIARNPEAPATGSQRSEGRVLMATGWGGQEEVSDPMVLAEGMCRQLEMMDRHGPAIGRQRVATAEWDYPPERDLRDDTPLQASMKMEAATGVQALLASGGVCLPTDVDYEIKTWATADRPLRDGLAAFQVPRGGLLYIEPPDIGGVAAATGIWTEATDAEPLAATKPVYSVSCGATIQVFINAVSTRLGFGNMQSRFQPELVAAYTDLSMVAAARKAEIELLELIQAKCLATQYNNQSAALGATPELIEAITKAREFFIYNHRLPRNIALTAIFPDWLKGLLKIDLAKQIGHSQNATWNSYEISDEQVEGLIKAHGINPIFTLDALPVKGSGTQTSGYPTQQLVPNTTAEAEQKKFPTAMMWMMFPEGSMQFLDGGRMDLGVVRDSTLDATNDYETFVETFEGIADRGFTNSAIQFVTFLANTGGTAATQTGLAG
jgi:hypothetical protein